MRFARVLMVLGGLGLAAGAFVPTYRNQEEQRKFVNGVLTIRSGQSVFESPWELCAGGVWWFSWMVLLPHLFGLSVAWFHAFDVHARRLHGLYRAASGLAMLPIFITALAVTFAGIANFMMENWLYATGIAVAAVAAWFFFLASVRALSRSELDRHAPLLRLLLYQGILTVLYSGLLLAIASKNGGPGPAIDVGLCAVAMLLVGTHLAAREVRKALMTLIAA